MINIYDVSPVEGKEMSWDQFWGNLSNLIAKVDDKMHSVVMCRNLPDDWKDQFQAIGQDDDTHVAWVRFDHRADHFHYAFIAWDETVLIEYVNHVGEEVLGGEMTSFVKEDKRVLH